MKREKKNRKAFSFLVELYIITRLRNYVGKKHKAAIE